MQTKLMQKLREILKKEKELLKVQLKNNFWYFVIALFFVLGCTILFKPIFNKVDFLDIKTSEIMDMFVLGVSLFVIIRHITWTFKNYILSRLYEFFVLVLTIVYLIYRLVFNDYWNFSYVTFNHEIFYFDFILGSLLLGILILKSNRFLNHLKIELEINPNTALISFSSVEDDSFIRAKSASDFMDIILQSKDKNAIAVGIVGPWGVGKSWYMKKMEARVIENYEGTHDAINLNPWKSPTGQDIIVEFLNVLKDKLAVNNGNFNRLIDSYVKSITKIDKTNSISTFISVMGNTEKEIDEFEKIQKELEKSNKKFVVFIDDIDRLGDAEVMEVLKLIRNTANFGRLYFVVGYDKAHLLKAISKTFKHKHEKFLDKIFQVEKELSIIPSYLLKKEFINELIKFKESKHVSKDNSIDIENQTLIIKDGLEGIGHAKYLATIFEMTIKNKRELIKLVNSFKIKVMYLKDERIDLVQLLILDILYQVDYVIYSRLQYESHSLLNYKNAELSFSNQYDSVLKLTMTGEISFAEDYNNTSHSDKILNAANEKNIGKVLLELLFNRSEGNSEYGKIYDLRYFNSFFEFSGALTSSIFIKEFLGDKSVDIDSKIDKYTHDGQLNELIKIVKDEGLKIIPNDSDKFERFIEIIDAISIKSKEGLLNKWYFESSMLDELYKGKANKRWSFIKKISKEFSDLNKYVFWEVELRELHNSENPIQEIEDCVSKMNNDNFFNVHQGDKWRIAIIDAISNNSWGNRVVERLFANESGLYSINEHYIILFREHIKLKDFVLKLKESIVKQEFLTFYRRFKANNHQPIEFERGTVEIVSSSETQFCGSKTYHNKTASRDSIEFRHIHYQERIEEDRRIFKDVPWIAKDEEINNKEEQFYGDIYYYKRNFNVDRLDCLKSITLQFFVDDILVKAELNEEVLFEGVQTGSHILAIKSFLNKGFIKDTNELKFEIENYPFSKIAPERTIDTVQPGENPYGIIYILELNYDMERLKTEKVYDLL